MFKLLTSGISRVLKQTFCLHRRKKVYGEYYRVDQTGDLYKHATCIRCRKELGLKFVGDDGLGHVFM